MGNNIELFDRYIDQTLTPEEKAVFEGRLGDDKQFASDFRTYLFILDGIYKEAEQEDMDFGVAMENISAQDLKKLLLSLRCDAMRTEKDSLVEVPDEESVCDDSDRELTREELIEDHEYRIAQMQTIHKTRLRYKNILWIGSVAAMFIIGIFTFFTIRQTQMDRIDNLIVAYNYIPDSNRGWESISSNDIASLEKVYRDASDEDMQAGEEAGMRLAMAYLKIHDRDKAKALLNEMCVKFKDNPEFVAQCRRILEELN
ncbi:MAG: hypothetical protein K2N05_03875 [Muribaculaceae bacterium]|nr:hypothetical protein [Muribaculaceae bacterium]